MYPAFSLHYSQLDKKLGLLDSLSLVHVVFESLPQAVLQAGAIVVKSVVYNDQQCFFARGALERRIDIRFTRCK